MLIEALGIPGEIKITLHRTKDQPNMTMCCEDLSLSNVKTWRIDTPSTFPSSQISIDF